MVSRLMASAEKPPMLGRFFDCFGIVAVIGAPHHHLFAAPAAKWIRHRRGKRDDAFWRAGKNDFITKRIGEFHEAHSNT